MARRGRDSTRRGDREDADVLLEGWLLLGNKNAAKESFLQRHGVGSVLSCCEAPREPCSVRMRHIAPMRDVPHEQLEPFLEECLNFLSEAKSRSENSGEKCLLHCYAGTSRSAAIALAYLICREDLSLQNAWELLQQQRPGARPNRGFAQQLIHLERGIHGCSSVTLADMGFDD